MGLTDQSHASLTKAERNYAQIEKQIPSIHIWQKFTLVTGHKPLTTILGPKASLPALAAARIQRWVIILSAYHYVFSPREKHSNADGLSRLPVELDTVDK